jgi:tetratricopeptide (TPR) repeat protein
MKQLFLVPTIIIFVLAGCGITVSDYDDAVLDGVSHLNTNKPEKALKDFTRAIEIDPTRADGYAGRGNVLQAMGQYEASLQDYDRAIEINPKLANAHVNRGSVYSHLGQYEKAIADYEKGLELDPKIDDPPGFLKRLFSNEPNTDKGIRKHLEYLKQKVKDQSG